MGPHWRRSVALIVTAVVAYAALAFLTAPLLPIWVTGSGLFNLLVIVVALVIAYGLVVRGGFAAFRVDPFGLDGE